MVLFPQKALVEKRTYERRRTFATCSTFENTMGAFVNTAWPPIRTSYYEIQLRHWLEKFHMSDTIILDGDNFRDNPFPVLKDLESRLGLKDYFSPEHFVKDNTTGYYCYQTFSHSEPECLKKDRQHPEVVERVLYMLNYHYKLHMDVFYNMINRTFNWIDLRH